MWELQSRQLITNHFTLNESMKMYGMLGNAPNEKAFKIIHTN